VAGGYGDTAMHVQVTGSEINFFSATQADVVDIHAGIDQTARERVANRLAAEPDVMTDDYFAGLQKVRICTTDAVGNVFIQLVGDTTPDIVGFETG
jgi:hypothetical protein